MRSLPHNLFFTKAIYEPARSRSKWTRCANLCVVVAVGIVLSACAFPRKDFSSMPDARVITVKQTGSGPQAVAPECSGLLQPSQYNKADDLRMSIAFGCATYTNLADQLARPEDLISPKSYAGQSSDTAADAVARYRANKVTPLRETMSTNAGKQH